MGRTADHRGPPRQKAPGLAGIGGIGEALGGSLRRPKATPAPWDLLLAFAEPGDKAVLPSGRNTNTTGTRQATQGERYGQL